MRYIPVITKFTDDCYVISFPDFPNNQGKFSHLGGAFIHAKYMLQNIISDMVHYGDTLPEPTLMKYVNGGNAFYIEVKHEGCM